MHFYSFNETSNISTAVFLIIYYYYYSNKVTKDRVHTAVSNDDLLEDSLVRVPKNRKE